MADGAGDIDDDFLWSGVLLLAYGGEGAEQEAVDVGEDGGAARGDAALLEGEGEIPEVGVYVGGGFLFGEVSAEEGREIGGVVALGGGAFDVRAGVEGAERWAIRG